MSAEQDAALRRRMAETERTRAKKAALAEVSGVRDEAVLDKLLALNITSETLAALSLLPLAAIAWADGTIDPNARAAVLRVAEKAGFNEQSPAYELLKGWLGRKPPSELVTAWEQYVVALAANLDDTSKRILRAELIGRARMVAEAAGGFLSLTARNSDVEKRVLDDLEKTFQVN